MADQKISGLPTDTSLDSNHYFLLNDPVGPVTKRTTLATLLSYLQSLTSIIKKSMIDYTSVDVYSSTEFDTGKKWIDGRAIYRKVITGNITIAVGANNIAHGISGITSLEPVNVTFSIVLSSTTRGTNRNLAWHRETGGNWANPTAFDGTNLVITSSFAWGASAYTAILEYVK